MKANILVVDDNPTNLKLASELLEFEGYTVACAVNAEEALEVVERGPPDLILMDIALPGMDGLALTRRLKADARTRHIRIIVLTASAMRGDAQKAHDAGCDGYVTKPFDTRRMTQMVADFLQQPPRTSGR